MNTILIGGTGTGKTYKAINEYSIGKFCYIAPCRQLVYESYIEYSNNDNLSTGEVNIFNSNNNNLFAVYESLNVDLLLNFSTIIIDEAHFLCDEERGHHLYNLIEVAKANNIYIILVTATLNFKFEGFEVIELKPFFNAPAKVEVEWEQFLKNIKDGLKTIVFSSSIRGAESNAQWIENELGVSAKALHSGILPSERLQLQYDFRNGKIDVIVATNILAQGINMPCENLFISEDMFSNEEMYIQKLGRLGRFGLTQRKEVYYCTSLPVKELKVRNKEVVKKAPQKDYDVDFNIKDGFYMTNNKQFIKVRNKKIVDSSYKSHELLSDTQFNYVNDVEDYSIIKYSKNFIKFLDKFYVNDKVKISLNIIKQEEKNIESVIRNIKNDKFDIKDLDYMFIPKNRQKQNKIKKEEKRK